MNANCVWDGLPYELLVHVFKFLGCESVFVCFIVNKRWSAGARDDQLWRHFFLQRFGEVCFSQAERRHPTSSWLRRFKERSNNSFCFHPLLAGNGVVFKHPDYKTVQSDGIRCPRVVLSTERQLRRSQEWLAKNLTNLKGTRAQAREERKAMFTQWAGRLTKIQFRCKTRYWEIGLFHHQQGGFSRFKSWDFAGSGTAQSGSPPPPFVAMSMWCATLCSQTVESNGSSTFDKHKIHIPITTEAYTIDVRVDGRGRKGGDKVRFAVNGVKLPAMPLPPPPFVMAFNTCANTGHELTIVCSDILRSH